ncbi:hypothetical protein JZ751_010971 [Albula glossodonta]|uniref:Centrosomal protein of 68 kDa n=1 Tax=Albula glossodonta TaxID=121402 RepID=A0A8T2P3U5_9TELE|nr:hypothetical protein JZ751_010971 [Albula glossodonta]
MALRVDKSFPELLSHMEPKGCGRWKTRIPLSTRSSHPGLPREGAQPIQGLPAKGTEKDKNGQKKTVTMAPISRYLTGRNQYMVRKPLIATDSHVSILKKTPTQEHLQQEVVAEESFGEVDILKDVEHQSCSLAEGNTDSYDFLTADTSSLSVSREDLTIPLATSDLRSWSPDDPGLNVEFQTCRVSRRCLSSPPVDFHSLSPKQMSPKWISTQRSSSLEACSTTSQFRRSKTEHKVVQSGGTSRNPRSLLTESKSRPPALHHMSPYQANYWACAIPKYLPPSPNRKSPSWDPDKEYEALLDYTYPLRPNQPSTLESTDSGLLQRTDPLLLDSGIELDRFCSSSNLSSTDQTLAGRRWGLKAAEQSSLAPKEHSHSKPFDRRLSGSWYSSMDQIRLSVESLLETDGKHAHHWMSQQKQGIFVPGDPAPTFIPTSCVLPARTMVWDWDEEFYALPSQLQELQVLSQKLQTISEQVHKPIDTSWESLEKEMSPAQSSMMLVENKSREEGPVEERERPLEEGQETVSGGPCSPQFSVEGEGLEASLQRLSREVNRSSVTEVASFMGCLSGMSQSGPCWSEVQSRMPMDQGDAEAKKSLLQHIQVFSSNLEKLIVWLYKVVEKMECLAPPTAEIESVKSSLAEYKNFQREVSAQQPLTAAVLHTGEILLHSINSTSPVLKETLMQIERQSRALETHAEHLFSSILLAMDSLTEPSSSDPEVQISRPSSQQKDLNESGFKEQE